MVFTYLGSGQGSQFVTPDGAVRYLNLGYLTEASDLTICEVAGSVIQPPASFCYTGRTPRASAGLRGPWTGPKMEA